MKNEHELPEFDKEHPIPMVASEEAKVKIKPKVAVNGRKATKKFASPRARRKYAQRKVSPGCVAVGAVKPHVFPKPRSSEMVALRRGEVREHKAEKK